MATTISPQVEQLLIRVVTAGHFKNQEEALSEAIRLLHEQTVNGNGTDEMTIPFEEWIEQFRKWSRKPRRGNPNMDDSRDSVYGERGE